MSPTDLKLSGSNILLGVTGGIAAYKAVDLASKLTAAAAKIKSILTENACQLIHPKRFEAVPHQAVSPSMWSATEDYRISHIEFVQQADIIVVAPATANIIAKIATGICDDLLSTTLCACWKKKVLIAPAMNNNMWDNPVVQENIEKLRQMKFTLIGPETGRLACGSVGPGRMAEPEDIVKAIEKIIG